MLYVKINFISSNVHTYFGDYLLKPSLHLIRLSQLFFFLDNFNRFSKEYKLTNVLYIPYYAMYMLLFILLFNRLSFYIIFYFLRL